MQNRRFLKTKENFCCERCDTKVTGTGYTNHCPKCLWSKHVDINPGDRAEPCGGMMEPIAVEIEKSTYMLTHRCNKCSHTKRNKVSEDDDMNAVITLTRNLNIKP